MTDLFSLARENVTALEAAERYGMSITRYKKTLCPWHNDTNPSLSFKGLRCKCFACNEGGSSIDLTAKLFGIPPKEAARKLVNDFGIDPTVQAKPQQLPKRARSRRFEDDAWVSYRQQLLAVYWASKDVLACYQPDNTDHVFDIALRAFAFTNRELLRLDYEEELYHGRASDK